jgi:hypothetical protein
MMTINRLAPSEVSGGTIDAHIRELLQKEKNKKALSLNDSSLWN